MVKFEEFEIELITNELKEYLKQNKQITETTNVMAILRERTDFFKEQYTIIEETIHNYLTYEETIKNETDIKNIINELENIEEKQKGVFTKANVIVSIISTVIVLIGSGNVDETIGFVMIFYIVYGLIFAYISKYIGLKKGIESGYIWGYFLGLIGLFVVCALPSENKEEINVVSNNNKYEDLEKLQKLKENGIITQSEFEVEKAKILK